METNRAILSNVKRKRIVYGNYYTKTNSIQEYDPYQIKKEELPGDICKFPPVQ